MLRFLLSWALLLVACTPAHAEDAQDIRGIYSGCVDATIGAAWSGFTSADLEDDSSSGALAASLYWTEIAIIAPSAAIYVCTGPAAGCGANTTNKRATAASAAWVLPARGLQGGVQTVSLRAGGAGVTVQLCGYFRKST